MNLNDTYRDLLTALVEGNDTRVSLVQPNTRTGADVIRFLDPVVISIPVHSGVPVPRWRRLSPHVPFADAIWQLMGVTDLTWLNKWAAYIWGPYAENDELPKAYGYRWGPQFNPALQHLQHDPSSRQVFVCTWDHLVDMSDRPQTPMPPCIIGFQLRISPDGGALDMTVFQRSCDILVGFPHDLMNFAILLHLFANTLDRAAGTLAFMISDLHMYMAQHAVARGMVDSAWIPPLWLDVDKGWNHRNVVDHKIRDQLVELVRDTVAPRIADTPRYELQVAR